MDLEEKVHLPFLSGAEKFLFAQVQESTCTNLFALVRRMAGANPTLGADDVETIVQMQAGSDAEYFMRVAGRVFDAIHAEAIHNTMLSDYRCQYIRSSK
jgi:hypothetical protein